MKEVAINDPSGFNGPWTLRVTDSVAASTGFLQDFSLQFTTGMIVSPTEGTISPFSFNQVLGGTTLTDDRGPRRSATITPPPRKQS